MALVTLTDALRASCRMEDFLTPFDELSKAERDALVDHVREISEGRGMCCSAGEARGFLRSLSPLQLGVWLECLTAVAEKFDLIGV